MSKKPNILRNSLLVLAFAAAVPTTWAQDAAPVKTSFNVSAQSSDTSPPTPRLMNLKAPDVKDVMSENEMAAAIQGDETEVLEPDTVAVHGAVAVPYVPSGFAALYWAAMHPMSAWRILTPAQ